MNVVKNIIPVLALIFFACNSGDKQSGFAVNGTFKNAKDQVIYLEQIDFATRIPQVVDSGSIKNEKFNVKAGAAEQGLYRLRTADDSSVFIFINDSKTVNFTGDRNDQSFAGSSFSGPANDLLKKFILDVDLLNKTFQQESMNLQQLRISKAQDSVIDAKTLVLSSIQDNFKKYVKATVDSTSHPVIAMYALDFAQSMSPEEMEKSVRALAGKFPKHNGVVSYVTAFNQMLEKFKQDQQKKTLATEGMPKVGDLAPDFTMNDVNGKPVSLSSFRGKYVLVDFWASWCGPCRDENPNVVRAYEKYKSRNFTILGVSLDREKDQWIKAIADDKLNWTQISDLKYWQSKAVELYKFGQTGIPYNVLLDPQGKIIATSLRDNALGSKLDELLK